LFRRQEFERLVACRGGFELLPYAGAEQVAQLRQIEMAMDTTPAANFIVV
jgi:hypothetical protein